MRRRQFLFSTGAALTYPFVARAQSDDLRSAIAKLPQLHSLQVMKGEDLVFAEAVRGAGLDRAANIKSCSKSIVALLLGAAIERGEIESVKATLSAVAPSLIPSNATQGIADITMENLVSLQAGLERTSGGNYGNWVSSSNWVADALTRPMVDKPGGGACSIRRGPHMCLARPWPMRQD